MDAPKSVVLVSGMTKGVSEAHLDQPLKAPTQHIIQVGCLI